MGSGIGLLGVGGGMIGGGAAKRKQAEVRRLRSFLPSPSRDTRASGSWRGNGDSQRQTNQTADPIFRIGRLRNDFQILHALTDRNLHQMAENDPAERTALSQPVLSHRLKANIVCHERAAERGGSFEQRVVKA